MNKNYSLPSILSRDFWKIILRGVSQVMFQENCWGGALILAGIFWGSYSSGFGEVAWGALIGGIVSTLTGYILKLSPEEGDMGLWGYNGVLVGCAMPTFLGSTPLMWLTLTLFAATSTWVMVGMNNILKRFKVTAYTFPFVLLTLFVLLATRVMHGLPAPYLSIPELPGPFSSTLQIDALSLTQYWLKGISQVFLINSAITGIIFIFALWICNKWAAIWACISSAIALGIAIMLECDSHYIANGLFGFSPVLTGIAVGCTFYKVNWRTAIYAIIAIVITVYIQAAMDTMVVPWGLPTLTAPFCITTWLFMLPQLKLNKCNRI